MAFDQSLRNDHDLCARYRGEDTSSPCIAAHAHSGSCVYFRQGRSSLYFYNVKGELLIHARLTPGAKFSVEEAAALYAYMTLVRKCKA